MKIACVEEIAYRMGFITLEKLEDLGRELAKNSYGQYLLAVAAEAREDSQPTTANML